jgi:uncharacterized protein YjbJ (UPF0337 family)
MGSTTDKIKGYANQAVGNAKEKIGQAIRSGKTETQGNVQSIKGKAQVATGQPHGSRPIRSDSWTGRASGCSRWASIRRSRSMPSMSG